MVTNKLFYIKRRKSQDKDRIEAEGKVFLEKVSTGFHELAKASNLLIIKGNQSEKLVSREIEKKLSLNLKLLK